MIEWIKGALGAVYSKDGLIGIAIVVALGLAIVAVLTYLGWNVQGFFG